MPLYIFRCDECGEEFEKNLRLKDFNIDVKCKCGNLAKKIPSWGGVFWTLGFNEKNGYSKKQKTHL